MPHKVDEKLQDLRLGMHAFALAGEFEPVRAEPVITELPRHARGYRLIVNFYRKSPEPLQAENRRFM